MRRGIRTHHFAGLKSAASSVGLRAHKWWAPRDSNPDSRKENSFYRRAQQCRIWPGARKKLAETDGLEPSCLLRPSLSRRVGYHYPTLPWNSGTDLNRIWRVWKPLPLPGGPEQKPLFQSFPRGPLSPPALPTRTLRSVPPRSVTREQRAWNIRLMSPTPFCARRPLIESPPVCAKPRLFVMPLFVARRAPNVAFIKLL